MEKFASIIITALFLTACGGDSEEQASATLELTSAQEEESPAQEETPAKMAAALEASPLNGLWAYPSGCHLVESISVADFLEIKEEQDNRGVFTSIRHRLTYATDDCSDVGTMSSAVDVSISTNSSTEFSDSSLEFDLYCVSLKDQQRCDDLALANTISLSGIEFDSSGDSEEIVLENLTLTLGDGTELTYVGTDIWTYNWTVTWYPDADGDGFGDRNAQGTESISQPEGVVDYVKNHQDCDDDPTTGASINPDATELNSDQIDSDCDGALSNAPFVVGDVGPAGGIVFQTDGTSGLEAAPTDQSSETGAEWGWCSGAEINGADSFDDGAQNTVDMLAADCPPMTAGHAVAASLVGEYSLNGYDDWYLPSIPEITTLHTQKATVGGFASDHYWSSLESSGSSAYAQDFGIGGTQTYYEKSYLYRVRAVRAFIDKNAVQEPTNITGLSAATQVNNSGKIYFNGTWKTGCIVDELANEAVNSRLKVSKHYNLLTDKTTYEFVVETNTSSGLECLSETGTVRGVGSAFEMSSNIAYETTEGEAAIKYNFEGKQLDYINFSIDPDTDDVVTDDAYVIYGGYSYYRP